MHHHGKVVSVRSLADKMAAPAVLLKSQSENRESSVLEQGTEGRVANH